MLIEQFFNVNDVSIYSKQIGNGKPIVFLHGGPGGEHRFFLPHVEPLSSSYQLIFYDQTGCGLSSPLISKDYTMEREVETLESLRKQLGLAKLNLVGESWGSMLALLYATSYPEKVEKILLTAAIGATTQGFQEFGVELNRRLTNEDRIALELASKNLKNGEGTIDEIFKIINPYYVYSSSTLTLKTKTESNVEVNQIIGKDISCYYDLRESLNKLSKIPIFVVQGDHDLITPEKIRTLLLSYLPHAELKILENCGHWTVVEKSDEFNSIARDFFN